MEQPPEERARLHEIGEAGVIARALKAAGRKRPPLTLGIGDDAALVTPPPGQLLSLTCDMLVEGVHFRREWSGPEHVGRKAAAVNVSDIAAMGGVPKAALVSLAVPADLGADWIDAFFAGVTAELRAHGCQLAGGDTVESPGPIVVDVTVAGFQETAVRRRGARPGDVLVLTGPVGGAAAGLALLEAGERWPGGQPKARALLAAQLIPKPRVREGQLLAAYAHAMTDLSDGLATSLALLTDAYGLGARIDEEQVPVAPELFWASGRLRRDPRAWIQNGGEEYELLAAVSARRVPVLWRNAQRRNITLYAIGEVTADPGLYWRRGGEEARIAADAFRHFDVERHVAHPSRA